MSDVAAHDSSEAQHPPRAAHKHPRSLLATGCKEITQPKLVLQDILDSV